MFVDWFWVWWLLSCFVACVVAQCCLRKKFTLVSQKQFSGEYIVSLRFGHQNGYGPLCTNEDNWWPNSFWLLIEGCARWWRPRRPSLFLYVYGGRKGSASCGPDKVMEEPLDYFSTENMPINVIIRLRFLPKCSTKCLRIDNWENCLPGHPLQFFRGPLKRS